MAKTLIAYMEHSQVPSRQALQEAVRNLRFPLTLDDAYVPFECAGYIPCTLDGEDAGVDIRFGASAAQPAGASQPQIGERDTAITLRWGGDPRERTSALILAAALAKGFGALVQGETGPCATEQLLDDARKAFAQLQAQ